MTAAERPTRIGPEEGWLTPVLVAVLVLVLATAIDDPAWVNGRQELTDGLVWCALLGAAVGFVGPKRGWGRWTTHLMGAIAAALIVPVIAGWAVEPGSSITEAFHATAAGTVQAYLDIAWRGRQYTNQDVHYILVLGGLVWGTAQFASYAVFGHRRPLNGVIVAGLVLLANMALTSRDQLPYLVLFAIVSLLLLIEMHVFEERTIWIRRQIGDPSAISSLYLRGGSVFIALAMIGSLMLTQRAASAPLAGAWEGLNRELVAWGESISGLLPQGGDYRGPTGVAFGPSFQIRNRWFSDSGIAFTATVPTTLPADTYWRAATYDTFLGDGWKMTGIDSVPVEANEPLLAGTPEDPSPALTDAYQVTIATDGFADRTLLSPGMPVSVNSASDVLLSGPGEAFAGVDLPGGGMTYQVDARVLRLSDQTAISGNLLRAASRDYPTDIRDEYTGVPGGAIGPAASQLLTTILQQANTDNPYDLAVAIRDYLKDGRNFVYATDLTGFQCDASTVECFAQTRHGYCLQYASTMAILLRAALPNDPIPTRLVQGFLPGTRTGTTDTVRNLDAHAWVEVYFPGYGWIPFDPTGGGVSRQPPLPTGSPVPTVTPATTGNGAAFPSGGFQTPDVGRHGGGTVSTPTSADNSSYIAITILLALLVLVAVLVAWLRGPRSEVSADAAWNAMSRGAGRLGFAPRPTETVYEYAASLGELVPVAQGDLHTLATAKVETDYARASLGHDRLRAVRDASRRLRVSMLRLLFRRRRRRRRLPWR